MSKSLIDEALADAKQLKELAYENAKRALVEQVTPRLKQLIEEEILSEGQHDNDQEVDAEDGDTTMHEGQHDNDQEVDNEDGDTTMHESSEFELSSESISAMAPLLRATENSGDKVELKVVSLGETILRACRIPAEKRTSQEVRKQISELFSRIEDTYSHVHEAKGIDAKRRERLEEKLESYYAELNEEFKEIGAMKKFSLNEADEMAPEAGAEQPGAEAAPAEAAGGEDVVITLKGLKDVDAESLNVDVQVEEPGEEDAEGGEAGGDDDFLAGLGGDEGGEQPMESAFESLGLSDDTILEIADEDLKREVARMQRMNESDSDVGKKMPKGGKIPVDDFGGGKDDGDPWLDHDVTVAEGLEEGDDAVVEIAIDESDEEVSEGEEDEAAMEESLRAESVKKIKAYKAAALKCRGTVRESRLKKAAMFEMKRIQESKARVAKLQESKKGATKNVASVMKEVQELRSQLAEVNLFNAKLLYANKLLQTEGLTVAQRNKIIDALDATKSLREAKMLYTKLAATLSGKAKKGTVTESARPAGRITGSGSRVGQSSGAPLNESKSESVEVDRWATLAGIK